MPVSDTGQVQDGSRDTGGGSAAAAALPSTERIVEEGMLIAMAAVRMALKNRIIVAALREHSDYDPERYADFARQELHAVAEQNVEDSTRVERLGSYLHRTTGAGKGRELENKRRDVIRLGRRRTLHDQVAERLRRIADDDEQVAALVDQARNDALTEINDAISMRLRAQHADPTRPEYVANRAARMQAVAAVDLPGLAQRTRSTD